MKQAPRGRRSRAVKSTASPGFLGKALRGFSVGGQVSVWQRVGCSVCLWSAGEECGKAGKAELERKVVLAFLNQECIEYHSVVSLQDEHKPTGQASLLSPGQPMGPRL